MSHHVHIGMAALLNEEVASLSNRNTGSRVPFSGL